MTENSQQATLQRELAKHQAAVADVSGKLSVIEAEEKRKREDQERKQRELAILARKREGFKRWISGTEREIAELKARAACEIDSACEDQAPGLFRLKDTLRELAIAVSVLEALKEYEPAIQVH
jgi:chromosome segregation ATPase